MAKKVAGIMGSDSDFPVVKSALTELKKYGVEFECRVMSAHRTPAEACELLQMQGQTASVLSFVPQVWLLTSLVLLPVIPHFLLSEYR